MNKRVVILFFVVGITLVFLLTFLFLQQRPRLKVFSEKCYKVLDLNGEKTILFLPNNYKDYRDFERDVFRKIKSLRRILPFKNAFRFFIYGDVHENMGCVSAEGILCDAIKVQYIAKSCPHDYIVVLSNEDDGFLRSSAYMNIALINAADEDIVLSHELGHVIADLADEYVLERELDEDRLMMSTNCDVVGCKKWEGRYQEVGCYMGCTNADFFRATRNSIMRNCYSSREFGPVNEAALKENLFVENE